MSTYDKKAIAQNNRMIGEASGFFAAAKGLSPRHTGKICSKIDSGHDYRSCTKGMIASYLQCRPGHIVNACLQALREAARDCE